MVDSSQNTLSVRHTFGLMLNVCVVLWATFVKLDTALPGASQCELNAKALCKLRWEVLNDPISLSLFLASIAIAAIGMWLSWRHKKLGLYVAIGLAFIWFPVGYLMLLGAGMRN
jgi:hypothetical protein